MFRVVRVPGDNSCLFHCINATCANGASTPAALRANVGQYVINNPNAFNAAGLGNRSPADYSNWIQDDRSWGGEPELNVFAVLYNVRFGLVNRATMQFQYIGNPAHPTVFLSYSGTHYDYVRQDSNPITHQFDGTGPTAASAMQAIRDQFATQAKSTNAKDSVKQGDVMKMLNAARDAFEAKLEEFKVVKEYKACMPQVVVGSETGRPRILGIFLGVPAANTYADSKDAPVDWNPFCQKPDNSKQSVLKWTKSIQFLADYVLNRKKIPALTDWLLSDGYLHKKWLEGDQTETKLTLADYSAAKSWCEALISTSDADVVIVFGSQIAWVVADLCHQLQFALSSTKTYTARLAAVASADAKSAPKTSPTKPIKQPTLKPTHLTNNGNYTFPFDTVKTGTCGKAAVFYCHHPNALFKAETKKYYDDLFGKIESFIVTNDFSK